MILQAGTKPGFIKFKASAKGLWEGGTDIITILPNQPVETANDPYIFSKQGLTSKANLSEKILGADVSFLPELKPGAFIFLIKEKKKTCLKF